MRWLLIVNLLAAVAFIFAAFMFAAANRTHAYSSYRELVLNKALVDKPTYTNGEPLDVEARLRGLAAAGSLSFLGYLGAVACVLNGLVFFLSRRPHRTEING
jgi:homoserine acetyltransferase